MNSTAELLDQVVRDLDAVLSGDGLAGLSDEERVRALQMVGAAFRRVEAVAVEAVATADVGDFPHVAGCRSQNELLRRVLLTDVRGASRIGTVVGRVFRDVSLVSGERLPARWPELRLALLDGVVGVAGFLAATGPVERVWDRLSVDQRLAADVALAGAARGHGLIRESENSSDAEGDADADVDGDAGAGAEGPSPTVEDLGRLAEDLAAVFDPDGVEPDDENSVRRRGITIGRLKDGLHSIRGYLTPEVAAQLQLILDALLNPKGGGPPMPGVAFSPSDGAGTGTGAGAGTDSGADSADDPFNSDDRAVIDDRTVAQKRHDALMAALAIAARHRIMPTLGGGSPTVVVTVDVSAVSGGAGSASGAAFGPTAGRWATIPGSDARVPVAVAAQIACTGAIQRVLSDEGRIIGISTTDRVFTVHQRRAIIARDKECLIPGCHVPASWCEIHHVTEHSRGGPTHTDNGVPLCWWHHRSLGRSGWEIRMHEGLPQVRGPGWWDPEQQWRTPRLSIFRPGAPTHGSPKRGSPKRGSSKRGSPKRRTSDPVRIE